ncbi:MAG TPA: alpha/beta hydrolase-fold protein [Panacibacter sp.]|nr:alpha/beta hydrolase-fold protein [Panacibacter sp.]HNP42896.1 alpha/beta hydrolase-fold protein [Panacibacter sp.]
MKQIRLKTSLLTSAYLILTVTLSHGQNTVFPVLRDMKEHIITSSFNSKKYQLDVLLPKNYQRTDTFRYPVLYVLDGKYSFTSFYSIASLLDLGKEISDFIIVAIDGEHLPDPDWMVNRFNDFTPTHIPQADSTWSAMFQLPYGALTSGGALSFLNTIQSDIIPFIDKQYKTTASRGLFGHSLGGLFVGYCLLTRPGLFQQYSMNSPSFWWNNNEMLTLETAFVKQHPTLSATNIFISAGALEGPAMISPVTEFANTLKAHYAGLPITSQIFESETHLSVVPAASSRTLKTFYIHSF